MQIDLVDFYKNATTYTHVNEADLEGQMATCSSYAYTAGAGSVDAEIRYERAVKIREKKEAELVREIMKEADGKKWKSVSELKMLFRENDAWDKLKEEELNKYAIWKKLTKLANAFEIKTKMLMSLNRRQLAKLEKGIRSDFESGT